MGIDDPTDVVAQQERDAEQAEQRKVQADYAASDLKWLMADKRGRRFIWRLLEISGPLRNPFTGQREFTDFNSGKMLIGQTLFADISLHCPEKYETMAKEARNQ